MTPSLTTCGVAGVMRRSVMTRAAALGIDIATGHLDFAMLRQAQEIFLTNAVFGIWPVRAIAGEKFSIGTVTRRLMADLAEAVEESHQT